MVSLATRKVLFGESNMLDCILGGQDYIHVLVNPTHTFNFDPIYSNNNNCDKFESYLLEHTFSTLEVIFK